MPVLTKKVRDTDRYLNDVKEATATALRAALPNMIVKYMSGDITITPLQPVGDKLRFVIEFQVTPKTKAPD